MTSSLHCDNGRVRVSFDVEQAGCESCGERIGAALSDVGAVESVDIDEDADTATVVLSGSAGRDAIDAALEKASAGAGHAYRVRTDTWRELGSAPWTGVPVEGRPPVSRVPSRP